MQHRRHVVCVFRQQQIKVQFVTQRCTAPRISGTTSSAEMHNVLDPKSTSVDVAEKRTEGRGPKTCLQKSRTWSQLAPCGLQPGPLALSCMAMTMHTGESLALFHSHADSFVITNDFWSGQFLWATAMNLSQVSCRHSWGSSSRSLLAFVCALNMSATIPRAAVTCDYHVTVSPRTHEQLRDKKTLCCAFTPMVHGVAHGWRHILHFRNVSTECIPAVSSHSRNSVLLAAATVRSTDPPAVWTSTHITVRGVLAKAS